MKVFERTAWLISFSLFGAIIAFLYIDASLGGKFEKWHPMGSPPDKAVKIVAIDSVETQSGLLYHYEYKTGCEIGCWVKVESIPPDTAIGQSLEPDYCLNYHPATENFIELKAMCYYGSPQIMLYINAIDKNGFVYYWMHGGGENGMWFFTAPFFGGVAGLLVGFLFVVFKPFSRPLAWFQKK